MSTRRLPLRLGVASLVGQAVDLLLPWRCAGCGRAGSPLCDSCAQRVEPMPASCCPRCGNGLDPPRLCPVCHALGDDPLSFARSAAVHSGVMRVAIHRLKYEGETALAPLLARYLVAALAAPEWREWRAAAIVATPVPLHPRRETERGYNQAALLAQGLCRATGLPFAPHLLERERETRPQVGLNAADRRRNVHASFLASPAAAGLSLLLVDDVFTTGATLRDCARAAREAGAVAVCALTLARPKLAPHSSEPMDL